MHDEDMNETHDIFILQLCDRLPAQLRETLIQKGYPTYITSDIRTLAASLRNLPQPILLVLCREGVDPSFADTKELISHADLHRYPLILGGTEVDSYENILNQHFVLATSLNAPLSNNDILEAIGYVVRSYHKLAAKKQTSEGKEPELPSALSIPVEEAPEVPVIEHPAYKRGADIPEVFFEALENLRIPVGALGGALYPHGIQEEMARQQNLLPQDRQLQDAARSICTDVGKWGRLHLYRTSFICRNILTALKVSDEYQEQAKAALFLFAQSFAGEKPDLLRREYFDARHTTLRRELCSRIKDSAMTVALELKSPEVGNLIAVLGRLVGREEGVTDTAPSVMASAIMAADITDRICFQSGFWNPRRTYSFMKKIKNGQMADFHPEVLCCVVKFLNEAMNGHPQAFVLAKHIRNNPGLKRAAEAWKEQKLTAEEKKVALINLMPGMRLSRPVMSYDGREILSSDVKLDQDLIWRLWQLSTVRPLNGPLVVFSKN